MAFYVPWSIYSFTFFVHSYLGLSRSLSLCLSLSLFLYSLFYILIFKSMRVAFACSWFSISYISYSHPWLYFKPRSLFRASTSSFSVSPLLPVVQYSSQPSMGSRSETRLHEITKRMKLSWHFYRWKRRGLNAAKKLWNIATVICSDLGMNWRNGKRQEAREKMNDQRFGSKLKHVPRFTFAVGLWLADKCE